MLLFGTNIQSTADELRKVQEAYLYNSLRNPKPAIAAAVRQLRIVYSMDAKGYAQLKRRLPYFVCGQFNPAFRRKKTSPIPRASSSTSTICLPSGCR